MTIMYIEKLKTIDSSPFYLNIKGYLYSFMFAAFVFQIYPGLHAPIIPAQDLFSDSQTIDKLSGTKHIDNATLGCEKSCKTITSNSIQKKIFWLEVTSSVNFYPADLITPYIGIVLKPPILLSNRPNV